ncbi:MAG: MerR family transcriptional regulator [Anaerotignum sp.]|nr:MerR family transcriptional regulator [Anaerotignum sp.]
MKKHSPELFKIGEICKILGITRKTLLIYEEMGLLTPAFKDTESGYRYYSADNMTQIRSIRSLQALGLSLKEVAAYYYDADNIDIYLQRLIDLRASLDRNIQMLQVRSTKRGDLTVHKTTLPQQVCYCQKCYGKTIDEVAEYLRETYVAAARTGKISMTARMFVTRTLQETEILDYTCCIPMDPAFDGPERVVFAETPALCIYHRGPYEELPLAMRALLNYTKENGIEITGPFRSIYLEGPPNRGKNSADYITQVAVPVKL